MERSEQLNRGKMQSPDSHSKPKEDLPYRIELWRDGGETSIERVLARALNAELARAIFKAAQGEYPQRRITLSKGARLVADSDGAN